MVYTTYVMPNKNTEPTVAINLTIEKELLDLVEDYRFRARHSTRINAIKALLRAGLAAEKKAKK